MNAPSFFLGYAPRALTPPDLAAFERAVMMAYDVITNPASPPGSLVLARMLLVMCGRAGVRS